MKRIFTLLAFVFSLTSCQIVEDVVYPFVDEVAVTKNPSDIYARHDVYSSDTMCLDTLKVSLFKSRMNISTHYQYIVEYPKVAWQKKHMKWITSRGGSSVRWYMFLALILLPLIGFWGALFFDKFKTSIEEKILSRKENSAIKAMDKANYDKAEKLYDECRKLDLKLHAGRTIDDLNYRIMPYVMLAMVLIEGAYLFMFNFCIPVISYARMASGWLCLLLNILLVLAVVSQLMMMYLYAEELDGYNGCKSSKWWGIPISYLLIIAFGVLLVKNTFVMPLDIISVALGIFCCCYVLVKNKNVNNPEVKVYAITLVLSSYIFMYFISYVMLIALTYLIIVCALMMALKFGDSGASFAYDQSQIRERMQHSPGKTYEQVSNDYYAEKRQEIEKRRKQQTEL